MSEPVHDPRNHPQSDQPSPTATEARATSDEELLAAQADDFAARVRRHERPTVEEYVAKHPELEEGIRKVFPAIIMIEETRSLELAPSGDGPGSTIGRYKLLERIGEGGFGVVFMAEQQQPIRRKVAVKVIKPGIDTRQVIARFEAERQALALMDHENIAKVLDAGATDTGRPYFVMELVHGIPITEFCDKNQLPPRERLELFVEVCRGVQHAHTKGIIHRDLKPTNVLVTLQDGVAVPKVIDFGVAKATGQQLTEKTLFTNFAQMVGTPLYMSPEQAEMTSIDVDTRSDVYSLGVLFYELLTGTTPLDSERLKRAAFDEVRRIIREEESQSPSTRLSTMGEQARSISLARGKSDPKQLHQLVRGELDWIVMKCLEKDRNRRYETANSLVSDLERYLNDEPVQACPPSLRYKLRKLARRHKAILMTVAIVALSLVLGTAVSIWEATVARRAEALADARLKAETQARRQGATELAKATTISDLLLQMLASANPDEVKGTNYTVRQLLDDFSARLSDQLIEQPEVEATIRATIGAAYQRMGALDKAEPHLAAALELRKRIFGHNHVEVANSLLAYARLKREQGMAEQALSSAKEALAIHRHLKLPEELTIKVLDEIALQVWAIGPHDQLEPVVDEIRSIAAKNPDKYPEVANLLHRLAETMNDPVVGEQYAREAVALHRRLHGATHPETAWGLQSLALTLYKQRKFADAERFYREALAIFRKQYGDFDPPVVLTMRNLARVLRNENDEPGLQKLREWGETIAVADGPDHESWLYGGEFFAELGQWDRAERFIIKSIELSPGLSRRKASDLSSRAFILVTHPDPEMRDPGRAIKLVRQAKELAPDVGWRTLGIAQYRAGEWKVAIESLDKAMTTRAGGDAFDWFFLAMAHWQLGRKQEASEWYHKAARWMEKNRPADEELIRFRAEAKELLGVANPQEQHPSSPPSAPGPAEINDKGTAPTPAKPSPEIVDK